VLVVRHRAGPGLQRQLDGDQDDPRTKTIRGGSSGKVDPALLALRQALGRGIRLLDASTGKSPDELSGDKTSSDLASAEEAQRQLNDPKVRKQRQAALDRTRRNAARGRSPYFNQPQSPEEQALDYLLGNDG
jgi:hypothetical protein